MNRQIRIGNHKTTVSTDNGVTRVVYHSTCVVEWDQEAHTITLRNGGYNTATTRKRINQALCQFGYGEDFSVIQEDFAWYLIYKTIGKRAPFIDGMVFNTVTGAIV